MQNSSEKISALNLKGVLRITVRPCQAPWITQPIKNFLKKKNRAYKTFIRNGQPEDKLQNITDMISHGAKPIEDAKGGCFVGVGKTLLDAQTGRKMYWFLINKILNKLRFP